MRNMESSSATTTLIGSLSRASERETTGPKQQRIFEGEMISNKLGPLLSNGFMEGDFILCETNKNKEAADSTCSTPIFLRGRLSLNEKKSSSLQLSDDDRTFKYSLSFVATDTASPSLSSGPLEGKLVFLERASQSKRFPYHPWFPQAARVFVGNLLFFSEKKTDSLDEGQPSTIEPKGKLSLFEVIEQIPICSSYDAVLKSYMNSSAPSVEEIFKNGLRSETPLTTRIACYRKLANTLRMANDDDDDFLVCCANSLGKKVLCASKKRGKIPKK